MAAALGCGFPASLVAKPGHGTKTLPVSRSGVPLKAGFLGQQGAFLWSAAVQHDPRKQSPKGWQKNKMRKPWFLNNHVE